MTTNNEQLFSMLGKLVGVLILIIGTSMFYYAWRVRHFARSVQAYIISADDHAMKSRRNRTTMFDSGFILGLTAMHFLVNSSNKKDDITKSDGGDAVAVVADDESLVDVELASEHNNKSLGTHKSFYECGVPTTRIRVPEPGVRLKDCIQLRVTPGNCAICLDAYKMNDQIMWSTNQACPHVFHLQCMTKWAEKTPSTEEDGDGGGAVTCPCCRQAFAYCTFVACSVEECAVVEQHRRDQQGDPSQQQAEEQIATEDQV